MFPFDDAGQPSGDHIAKLLELAADPSRVPEGLSLRSLGGFGAPGEDRFMMNNYLRERGDANIKSNADLAAKATFYSDPNFPDRRQPRLNAERAQVLDTATRVQTRYAMQIVLLQCMQEQRLDALVAPTATVPPRKLTSPREPAVNGRSPVGWSMLGQQGFPVITVPAGFTTEIWDRVRDGDGTRLVGPIRGQASSRRRFRRRVRSTKRCCFASRLRTRPQRSTVSHHAASGRWRESRSVSRDPGPGDSGSGISGIRGSGFGIRGSGLEIRGSG